MAGTKKKRGTQSKFVVDGARRAWRAAEPEIREQVAREFREELQNASFFKRFLVKRRMSREVQRRLDELAPPGALY